MSFPIRLSTSLPDSKSLGKDAEANKRDIVTYGSFLLKALPWVR